MATQKKQLRVTLKRSINRRTAKHKACVTGLGLRRIGHSVTVADTAENRGMINKVSYLLTIDEI
jgi:large subunit ribosomal protein L30